MNTQARIGADVQRRQHTFGSRLSAVAGIVLLWLLATASVAAAAFTATTSTTFTLGTGSMSGLAPLGGSLSRTGPTTCDVTWTAAPGVPGTPVSVRYEVRDSAGATLATVADTAASVTVGSGTGTVRVRTVIGTWASPERDLGACGQAPDQPTNFTVTPVTATTAAASWTTGAGSAGGLTSTVTAYPGAVTCTAPGAGTSCTLTGLTPGTTYAVNVTTTNWVGTSPASPRKPVRTAYPSRLVWQGFGGSVTVGITPGDHAEPRQISASTFVKLSEGENTLCAIESGGALWCAGLNGSGELAQGDQVARNTFVRVGAGDQWSDVAVGLGVVCATKVDTTFWCWGSGANGSMGNNTTTAANPNPVQVVGMEGSTPIVRAKTVCALKSGDLYCWGAGTVGQAGNGGTADVLTPTKVASATPWLTVDLGSAHGCGVKTDHTLWCWGDRTRGSLGFGDSTPVAPSTPVTQVGTATDWQSVATSKYATCALKMDGSRWCAGEGRIRGQGTDLMVFEFTPDRGGRTFTALSSTTAALCAKDATGWSCASDASVLLGRSAGEQRVLTPMVLPDAGSDPIAQVGTRSSDACALTDGGKLWCWGSVMSAFFQRTGTPQPMGLYVDDLWVAAATGSQHGCGIQADSTLWCWGDNGAGQLGSGTTGGVYAQTQVGTSTWRTLAASSRSTCAVRSDSTLWCWGANASGQLGVGTTTPSNSPAQVGTDSDWLTVALGSYGATSRSSTEGSVTTCAIRLDLTLWCWGDGSQGQLGQSDTQSATTPVRVGTAADWTDVSVGGGQVCAVRRDASLWCQGENDEGELGVGDTTRRTEMTPVGADYLAVAAGGDFSCARRTDSSLWCWGRGTEGQLGTGDGTSSTTPVRVGTATDWRTVGAGATNVCATTSGRELWCWGDNADLQNADARALPTLAPRKVESLSSWLGSGGLDRSLSLTTDPKPPAVGNLAWSTPAEGSLTLTWDAAPDAMGYSVALVQRVRSREVARCETKALTCTFENLDTTRIYKAVVRVRTATGWGAPASVPLMQATAARTLRFTGDSGSGLSTASDRWAPAPMTTGPWKKMSASAGSACGISSTDRLSCWGDNASGQLGLGNLTYQNAPVVVGAQTWSDVAVGTSHVCAIRTDGSLWCQGKGTSGQLGVGGTTDSSTAVQVTSPATTWTSVVAGTDFSCALDSSSRLWCWGVNGRGQLGTGGTATSTTPAQIPGAFVWVAAGDNSACAIDTATQLWCWGANDGGMLGLGGAGGVDQLSPVQVMGAGFTAVDLGTTQMCALRGAALSCAGLNAKGEVGDGTITQRTSLAAVSGSWTQVSAAASSTCAVATTGTMHCWGQSGTAGDGRVGDVTSPRQVGTATDWAAVTLGGEVSFARDASGNISSWRRHPVGTTGPDTLLARPTRSGSTSAVSSLTVRQLSSHGTAAAGTTTPLTSGTACAIDVSWQLWCWGDNSTGALGVGDTTSRRAPVQVSPGSQWSSVSVGNGTVCGIQSDDSLWCWGRNNLGQVGDSTTTMRTAPVNVSRGLEFYAVSVGDLHACGLRNAGGGDSKLSCWGDASQRQRLNASTTWAVAPNDTATSADLVSAGQVATCFTNFSTSVPSDNRVVRCQGSNARWALGTNNAGTTSTTISQHAGVSQLVVTDNLSCMIRAAGEVSCWGLNTYGQAGTGNTSAINVAPFPTWATRATSLAVGVRHACITSNSRALLCSGYNTSGQFGKGDTAGTYTTPQTVAGLIADGVSGAGLGTFLTTKP